MKRRFPIIIDNQRGFMFPVVLFIIAILILVVNTNIQLFINERNMTKHQIQQVKIETLFQSSRVLFQDELTSALPPGKERSYSLPDGEVKITLISVTETAIHASFTIYPLNEPISYTISDTFRLEYPIQ
ncbi:hypothetical protein D8M04_02075 [Oceanobacillus piezotolerans]|uniref:Competence protein ComG n=1 Tax=Oceanobacillus piezotolerans TaxID=2448030 RepID=A0A498DAE2_9BACI|nr:hypothetical protein [Oceanobacillus piezotolerans]RLL48084.1 hypothetical protein D8M04_02075 [Oceanobacillus piezotolerans]